MDAPSSPPAHGRLPARGLGRGGQGGPTAPPPSCSFRGPGRAGSLAARVLPAPGRRPPGPGSRPRRCCTPATSCSWSTPMRTGTSCSSDPLARGHGAVARRCRGGAAGRGDPPASSRWPSLAIALGVALMALKGGGGRASPAPASSARLRPWDGRVHGLLHPRRRGRRPRPARPRASRCGCSSATGSHGRWASATGGRRRSRGSRRFGGAGSGRRRHVARLVLDRYLGVHAGADCARRRAARDQRALRAMLIAVFVLGERAGPWRGRRRV